LRPFPSTTSERTIPLLTYAYKVGKLIPNSAAACPELKYRSSPIQ
jgi:hypothetical protein